MDDASYVITPFDLLKQTTYITPTHLPRHLLENNQLVLYVDSTKNERTYLDGCKE